MGASYVCKKNSIRKGKEQSNNNSTAHVSEELEATTTEIHFRRSLVCFIVIVPAMGMKNGGGGESISK